MVSVIRAKRRLGWPRGRLRSGAFLGAALCVALAWLPPLLEAQHDRAAMIRTLRTASDFRVRVQMAFAMGNTRDPSLRPHLERALRDSNPAVRAAAATGLGRLGSRAALRALRRARRDNSASVRMQVERSIRTLESAGTETQTARAPRRRPTGMGEVYTPVTVLPRAGTVPWPRVRYVVVLGRMANRSSFRGGEVLAARLRDEVARNLMLLRGVAVFRGESEVDARARREIQRRRLPKLQLDGNLTDVDRSRRRGEVSVRCAVSLMLLEEGNIRGMMNGAATGSEAPRRDPQQQQRLAQQALSAAVRSAMSGAPNALRRAVRGS